MSDIGGQTEYHRRFLTTSMNSLVKKGYATRSEEQDRRVVFIHLT